MARTGNGYRPHPGASEGVEWPIGPAGRRRPRWPRPNLSRLVPLLIRDIASASPSSLMCGPSVSWSWPARARRARAGRPSAPCGSRTGRAARSPESVESFEHALPGPEHPVRDHAAPAVLPIVGRRRSASRPSSTSSSSCRRRSMAPSIGPTGTCVLDGPAFEKALRPLGAALPRRVRSAGNTRSISFKATWSSASRLEKPPNSFAPVGLCAGPTMIAHVSGARPDDDAPDTPLTGDAARPALGVSVGRAAIEQGWRPIEPLPSNRPEAGRKPRRPPGTDRAVRRTRGSDSPSTSIPRREEPRAVRCTGTRARPPGGCWRVRTWSP